jgi:hypothetical protein
MGKYSEVFVGIDTAKKKHAVAIVDAGRDGEHGEIDSASATIERLIKKLASKYERCESAKLDRRVMGSIGRLCVGSRVRGRGGFDDTKEARRSDQDQSTRCGDPGAVVSGGRIDIGLGL